MSTRSLLAALAALLGTLALLVAPAEAAHLGDPQQLTTPWTKDVSPDNALPEYPRPQLTRARWQNLNGLWQFAKAEAGEQPPVGKDLAERILVPYPVESMLSRINRAGIDRMWYRRTFTVPSAWKGQRLQLHFQAVDYQAKIIVNGKEVTTHKGGYDAFSVDVTDALTGTGAQELIVGVEDLTDIATQAVGKQRPDPGGIFYTPATGIWQTVWMEPTAPARIDRLDATPDVAAKALRLNVRSSGTTTQTVEATAYAGDKPVGSVTGAPGTELKLPVADPKVWTPADPYLYTLKVKLRDGAQTVDDVGSYFGMRSIKLGKTPDGKTRMMLNGKFVMQVGTLDQGYWPDGIYTAPTDEALRFDLAEHKRLGFNMVRKHVKVEPDRWYYWADKLGLIVWQDMPSTFGGHSPPAQVKQQFETELRELVDQHRSHPSITMWVPYNEGWGEYEPKRIADLVKSWDPSRLVNANSGVNCCDSLPDGGEGDIYDDHTYVGPGAPLQQGPRAAVVGEYGGLGLKVDGHMYDPEKGFAYEMTPDKATLSRRYAEIHGKLEQVVRQCGVSGSVYTQITDVENEVNGVYTYDRRVLKPDAAAVREANRKVIEAGGKIGARRPGKPGLDGVSFYAFDEGSGSTAADSIGDHDATLKNGASWTAGHSGSALSLNGVDQYADTGAPILDTAGNYTASAWVKLDKTGGFATAISQDGGDHSAFFLQYSEADKRFAFSFAGVRALAPSAPETGKWYHLTGVRNVSDGSLTLYVDGAKAGTASACLGDVSTGNTVIGRAKFGGNPVDFWPGAIDKVRLFDRALSAAEVAELYQSGGR